MNIFSIIASIVNAGLLAGALSGVFLDIPARSNLINKERVQTTLLQAVSERDTEMEAIKQRTQQLENENQLLPAKIEEVKNNLKIREIDLSVKKKKFEKASIAFENLQKQNEAKDPSTSDGRSGQEKEIKILQTSSTDPDI